MASAALPPPQEQSIVVTVAFAEKFHLSPLTPNVLKEGAQWNMASLQKLHRLDDGFKRLYLRILEQAQHAFLESKGRGRRRRLASQFTVSYCLNRYEAQKTFQLRCLGKTLKYDRTLERKEFLLKHCFGRQFI